VPRSIANLDAAKMPVIAIPVALAHEAAGRLFDVNRRGCIVIPSLGNCDSLTIPKSVLL